MESLLFSFKYDCVNITMILFSSGIISTDVDIQTRIRRSREGMRRKKVPLTPPCFFYNKNWTTFCIQCTIDTSLVSRALLELFSYFSFNNLSSLVFLLRWWGFHRTRYQRLAAYSPLPLIFPISQTYGSTPNNSWNGTNISRKFPVQKLVWELVIGNTLTWCYV